MAETAAEQIRAPTTRTICKENDVEIIKGRVSGNHVFLVISVAPDLTVYMQDPYLRKSYMMIIDPGRDLPKREYFVGAADNITNGIIM